MEVVKNRNIAYQVNAWIDISDEPIDRKVGLPIKNALNYIVKDDRNEGRCNTKNTRDFTYICFYRFDYV